jgi:hemolysin III
MSVVIVWDRAEERANAATHALGLLGSLAGAAIVLYAAAQRGGAWQICGCAVYAFTLIAVYAASTLSHAVRRPGLRHALRIADQAMIFLFIAGTYTPIALTWLRAQPWWVLHLLVWATAISGFLSKTLFAHRVRLGTVSVIMYVLLGWLPTISFLPMFHAIPGGLTRWVVAGGSCYMAGILFFQFDHRVRYFHASWHLLVMAGSACHYLGILLYCTGGGA